MLELMRGMNPLTGELYLDALHMTRITREAYSLICGKYPHPQTIVPGGMSSTVDLYVMNEILTRLQKVFDFSKKVVGIWDDITAFFYDLDPLYRQIGARTKTLVDVGIFDHPDIYDALTRTRGSGATGAGRPRA